MYGKKFKSVLPTKVKGMQHLQSAVATKFDFEDVKHLKHPKLLATTCTKSPMNLSSQNDNNLIESGDGVLYVVDQEPHTQHVKEFKINSS